MGTSPIRPHGFIHDLCIALAHRWEPERLFVILTAYFDESGTHGGSPSTVVAGLMANASQWSRFERKLRKVQRKFGFKVFHAKHFKKKSGEFRGWSDTKCLDLIVDMAEITGRGLMEACTFPLDNAEYQRDYRGGDKPRKLILDSAYGLAFRMCLVHLTKQAMRRLSPKKGNRLHIVLEAGHRNSGDAERIFWEFKKELGASGVYLLDTVTTAEKDECDPLMIADFIAHTTYMLDLKQRAGAPPRELHMTPGKTGIMHLEFPPGGIAEMKRKLLEGYKPSGFKILEERQLS